MKDLLNSFYKLDIKYFINTFVFFLLILFISVVYVNIKNKNFYYLFKTKEVNSILKTDDYNIVTDTFIPKGNRINKDFEIRIDVEVTNNNQYFTYFANRDLELFINDKKIPIMEKSKIKKYKLGSYEQISPFKTINRKIYYKYNSKKPLIYKKIDFKLTKYPEIRYPFVN